MVALSQLLSVVPFVIALQALASPTQTDAIHGLLARQTSPINPNAIPDKCKSACDSFIKNTQQCTSITCLCTDSNMDSIANCLNCAASVDKSDSNIKLAQNGVNAIVDSCKAAGTPVKSVTISANGATSFQVVNVGALAIAALGMTFLLV